MSKNSVDILIKARDEASKQFSSVGNAANSLSHTLRNVAIAAAGYLTAKEIKGFLEESVRSFVRQEGAVVKLAKSLDILGKKYQTRMFEEFASGLQSVTVYGDEAILELMALGASMGNLSGVELERATKAAIGLSEAFSIDLQASMTLIAKAAQGNTSALSRYGIVVDENMSSQEKLNYVLEQGISKFPIATAMTKTLGGAMQQMRNSVDDVKEEIGRALAPTIASLSQKIKTFAEENKAAISEWAQKIMAYINLIKDMFVSFIKFLASDYKSGFETSLGMAYKVFEGFASSIRYLFEQTGDAISKELIRGIIAGSTSVLYFSTKGVVDALVGAAFDGTTFKEHIQNVADYGKGIADELVPSSDIDIADEFKKVGDILKDSIIDAGKLLPKEFLDNIGSDFERLKQSMQNINTGALSPEETDEEKAKRLSDASKYKGGANGLPYELVSLKGLFSTVESRFLQGSPQNNYYGNMTKHNQQTARNTKETANNTRDVIGKLDDVIKKLGSVDGTLLEVSI